MGRYRLDFDDDDDLSEAETVYGREEEGEVIDAIPSDGSDIDVNGYGRRVKSKGSIGRSAVQNIYGDQSSMSVDGNDSRYVYSHSTDYQQGDLQNCHSDTDNDDDDDDDSNNHKHSRSCQPSKHIHTPQEEESPSSRDYRDNYDRLKKEHRRFDLFNRRWQRAVSESDDEQEQHQQGAFENDVYGPLVSRPANDARLHSYTHDSQHNQMQPQNHYHVYYVQPPDTNGATKRTSCWQSMPFILALLAILTNLILVYGPPAPPGVDDATIGNSFSWSDFLAHQGHLLAHLIYVWCFQIPKHVGGWCWEGVRHDLWYIAKSRSQSSSSSSIRDDSRGCQFNSTLLPAKLSHFVAPNQILNLQKELQKSFTGQDHALSILSQSILEWNQAANLAEAGTLQGGGAPFISYIAGGIGTGKRHLSAALANTLFVCPIDEETPISPILDLSGSLGQTTESPGIQHTRSIQNSESATTNSVESKIVQRLLDYQQTTSSAFVATLPEPSMEISDEIKPQYDLATFLAKVHREPRLSRVIILVLSAPPTSSSAMTPTKASTVRIIERALQKFGPQQAQLELPAFLAYEVDRIYGSELSSVPSSSISKIFHAIVPLFPLSADSMRQSLQRQFKEAILHATRESNEESGQPSRSSISKVEFSRSLLDSLLRRNIEFQTWINKSTNEEVYSYSLQGAHPIGPLVRRSLLSLGTCWQAIQFKTDSRPTRQRGFFEGMFSRWQQHAVDGSRSYTLQMKLEDGSHHTALVQVCLDTIHASGQVGNADSENDAFNNLDQERSCDLVCRVQL